jgi:hypothetical protein
MCSSFHSRRAAGWILVALATAAPGVRAQQSIIDRAQQAGPAPAGPVMAGPAPAAPGADTDAGTQRVAEPRRLPFLVTASVSEQLYATGNVFLVDDSSAVADTGALVSSTTLSVDINTLPRVVGNGQLVAGASLVYQRNIHDLATSDQDIADLDFDNYALPLSAAFRWGHGWEASTSLTFGALYSVGDEPSHELLYRHITPALGLRKLTELREGLILSTGASVSYADTWASLHDVLPDFGYRQDRNDKIEGSLDAALYRFSGPWTIAPSIRLAYGHYLHWEEGSSIAYDRDDLTFNTGLTVAYALGRWGSLRAYANYDVRTSDTGPIGDYDYDAGTVGVGVSLSMRF